MSKRGTCSAVPASEVGGVIADLYERVGGRNGQQWLDRVKETLRTKLSDPLPQKEEPTPDWEVWQSILVGGRPWVRGFLWKLKRSHCTVEKGAKQLLFSKAFDVYRYGDRSLQKIDLVKVTREDLGIKVHPESAHLGTPIAEVVMSAARKGLSLCPTDVVLQLRLHYAQPRDTRFLIMTRPLPLGGMYGLFELRHYGNEKYFPALSVKTILCPYSDLIGGCYEAELVFWKAPLKACGAGGHELTGWDI